MSIPRTPSLVRALVCAAVFIPVSAFAQNIAIVNGKGVPKSRVDALIQQVTRSGQQPVTPDLEAKVKDEVVLREIFVQEAESRGIQGSTEYAQQMEIARQGILIRALFAQYEKDNPVSDEEVKAEYDKYKTAGSGTEYRARHILVDKEDLARSLIAQIKKGTKFEELAKKHSKDPGSGRNGGDLDWAAANAYVPEFSQAMVKLKQGQMTDEPVKTQFGWHIIKLDGQREANFPALEQVKPQILQQMREKKLMAFRDDLKNKAKTDYKFSTTN